MNDDILTRQTPWKLQVEEMQVDDILNFPVENYMYVKNMVFGAMRKLHPDRKFKIRISIDKKMLAVMRLSDRL